MTSLQPTDQALWAQGDPDAFGQLYERHARAVQAFCLRRTTDPAASEDLTSLVFLEAWRARRRVAPAGDCARALLLGIATNVLRHHWRARRRHAAAMARIHAAEARVAEGHEDEAIARTDALTQVRAAREHVRALPARELDVLALIVWGELTYEQAAEALGVPIGTVRSRMARARARLQRSLSPLSVCLAPSETSAAIVTKEGSTK